MLERGGGELPLKLARIERDELSALVLQADGGDGGGVDLPCCQWSRRNRLLRQQRW